MSKLVMEDIFIGPLERGSGAYFNKGIVVGDRTNVVGRRLYIEAAEIGIQAGNDCEVDVAESIIRNPHAPVPVELVEAMFADLKRGKEENELIDKYGKQMEAAGFDINTWLDRGKKFIDLIVAAARACGHG